jgi:hypothetical protein
MDLANDERISNLIQEIQVEKDSRRLTELVAELTRLMDEQHLAKANSTPQNGEPASA